LIEKICEVEGIDECPLLLDFEIVVPEVSRYLLLHSYAIWIKQEERAVVVEVLYCEGHFGWNAFQVGTCEGGLDKPGTGSPSRYSAMTKSIAARFCTLPWK
jgi:hypothetical protein